MPLTYDWPAVLDIRDYDMNLMGSSKSGPPSLGGMQQVAVSPNDRWKCSFSVPVGLDKVLPYRAFLAKLDGRKNYCRVPAFDGLDAIGLAGFYKEQPQEFDDGSGYAVPTFDVTLAIANVKDARQIQVYCADAYPPLEGQRFSMPDDRLHEIAAVARQGPNLYLLSFRPGLRSDFAAGVDINFSAPVCLMRLQTDTSGALQLMMRRFGTPTIDFIEV